MKMMMTLILTLFFTVSLTAKNTVNTDEKPKANTAIKVALCTVNVDCDGDGEVDYTGTVDCENAGALAQQFVNAC